MSEQEEHLDASARSLLRLWGLTDEAVERVDVGVNKATWRVGDFWLSSEVASGKEQAARLEQLLARVAAQFAGDIAVPAFVPSSDGVVVESGGRTWWLTRNIEGRHPDPAEPQDMVAVAAGLALLHDRLRGIPRELAVSKDTCEGLFRAGEVIVRDDRLGFSADDLAAAREAADLVVDRLEAIRRPGMQITHGDPSNPNLFIGSSPRRLTGAIDWDYARYDLLLSDIATVGQTILFRSGSTQPRAYLERVLTAYTEAGGLALPLQDVLVGVIMVLFEAIAHHGNRYLLGQGGYDRVSGRVENIRTVLSLLAA
ncbi:phosphotransferase enzyme family protein [Streptomyces sp. NBC_01538]|uniref:phosphotransferase enzyme family protein n=1 Tax=Streptomyces sp. NBC_01538 TaxID=2903897 RepID=UPI003868B338